MPSLFRYLAAVLTLLPMLGFAQADREGGWEIGAGLVDLSSVDVKGTSGASLRVDDETGIGFSGAYHFTNRLALGLDLSYSEPSYVATLTPDGAGAPQTIRATMGVDVINFKGIFHLLENDITPYVEVGAGWTYVDSNIIEGYGGSVCWWDPWWGYVCEDYFDTYTETRPSHSYALGIRWDMNQDMVLRASWGVMEIDTSRAAEDIELDTIQLMFGWRF